MKGNDLLIYTNVSGTQRAIGGAKSCDIQHDCEAIEVSSPNSSQSKEFIPGRKTWQITVSGLLSTMKNLLQVGRVVSVSVRTSRSLVSLDVLTGTAIITHMQETGTRGSLATYSMTLQGTGDLIDPSTTPQTGPIEKS